jgi:hypothetical protein
MVQIKRNPNVDRKGLLTSHKYFFWGYQGSEAFFVNMNRDLFFKSSFCDHRIFPVNQEVIRMPLAQLLEKFEEQPFPPPKLSYIFHMAHGGSTLLSRALDIKGSDIVYREPAALRQLGVTAAESGFGDGPTGIWQRVLKLSTALLAKSDQKPARVIIKANVPVNFMIPNLMDIHPNTRGIILYAGLEDYLLSVLKSDGHRGWVRHVLREVGNAVTAIVGISASELEELSDAEAAACLWMTQIHLFDKALEKYSNLRSLDSEVFYSQPKQVLMKACQLYRISVKDDKIGAIVKSGLFTRYSKDPNKPYDNSIRLENKNSLRAEIGDELRAANKWIQGRLDHCPLPESMARRLTAKKTELLTTAT